MACLRSILCLTMLLAPIAAAVAPLIGDVPDQVIAQNTNTSTLYFVVGDTETTFTALTVTATSSNPGLIPQGPANLTLGGLNAQRSIIVTPAAGQTGTGLITLTVSDGESLSSSSTFNVTVTAPNTPPTLSGLAGHQRISPGQTPPAMPFSIGDVETPANMLVVTASSSNPSLVADNAIVTGGSGTERTVQITPVVGQ